MAAKCKKCDAEIRWARIDGRWHPFEVESDPKGTHVLRADPIDGEHHALYALPPGRPALRGARHLSHFATCPAASSFRREGYGR